MNLIGGLIGGIIGALLGGGLWAGVAYVTGYEIGWIAIGVGLACGFGVFIGSAGNAGPAGGLIAVVASIAAIVGGKYAAVQLILDRDLSGDLDTELVISYIADEVAMEYMDDGYAVNWPAGAVPFEGVTAEEYPNDVWQEAEWRWATMSSREQDAFRNDLHSHLTGIRDEIAGAGFLQSFSPIDILFLVLAVASAFKLGMGGDDQEQPDAQMF